MSRGSIGRNGFLSFFPEASLIEKRNFEALRLKYQARLGQSTVRWGFMLDPEEWLQPRADTTTRFREYKNFGSVIIDSSEYSPVTAHSLEYDAKIWMHGQDTTFVHVDAFPGVHAMRDQLSLAAQYIESNSEFSKRSYVAGVTYSELARAARRIGFHPMEISRIDGGYATQLRAVHMAYCAINGKSPDHFEPSAVYMPTEEFVQTFHPSIEAPV